MARFDAETHHFVVKLLVDEVDAFLQLHIHRIERLLIGLEQQVVVAALLPSNFPFVSLIPNEPTLVSFPFQVQAIALSGTNTTRGNFTQRHRDRVTP